MNTSRIQTIGKWCLHYLMASSVYSDKDLEKLTLEVLREVVYRACMIMLPLALSIGVVMMWDIQDERLNWFQVALAAMLWINVWTVLRSNRQIVSFMGLLISGFVILYAHILTGNVPLIYFCLAFTAPFYLLPTRRQTILANLVWWMSSGALALHSLPLLEAVIFMSVHALIWFYIETIFSLIAVNEKELKYQAERDPLTNVYNRRAMESALSDALSLQERHNISSSVIMIDIDHFKQINDKYGHHEGDTVLKNFAGFLESRLRGADKIFRFGGEEFVVVLINTSLNHAYLVAESIREQLSQTAIAPNKQITVSCGVAVSRSEDTVDDWLKRGDEALYRAKHGGRDRVELELGAPPSVSARRAGLA